MNWSQPDAEGISTAFLDEGGPRRPNRRRIVAALKAHPEEVLLWPEARRQLLSEWHALGSARSRWDTLLKVAGTRRAQLAFDLRDALLKCGLVHLEQKRGRDGRWTATWLQLNLGDVPKRLGWPDKAEREVEWDRLRSVPFSDQALASAARLLDHVSLPIAIQRLRILQAIARWKELGRAGTRRDFSQWATGATKDVTFTDWKWLERTVPLEEFGIERHTPLFLLRAPISLVTSDGQLDLKSIPDLVGLSAALLRQVVRIEGTCGAWRLVENRTSFERAARKYGGYDGVVWLPGYAPVWWREQMEMLLRSSPAPGLIACDPDPAGIEIAMDAGSIWERLGVTWKPWCMDADDLASLVIKRGLSGDDDTILKRLEAKKLPDGLRRLLEFMASSRTKGEQEALDL